MEWIRWFGHMIKVNDSFVESELGQAWGTRYLGKAISEMDQWSGRVLERVDRQWIECAGDISAMADNIYREKFL